MYNDIIVDHFTDPKYVGDIENSDVEFEIGNPVCGDRIRVQFIRDGGQVKDIAFRAWGCATSIATADIFCSSVIDKSSADIVGRSTEEIESMLGELDPSQHHCIHILHELHSKLAEELNTGAEV